MKSLMKRNEIYVGIIIILVSLIIGFANRTFFSFENLADLTRASTVNGIFAVGAYLVILSGGIDVSFPAIATVSTYMTLQLFPADAPGGNLFLFFFVACLAGCIMGLINGIFIAYFRFPPLIVTLATSSLYYGIQFVFLGSFRINRMPQYIMDLSRARLLSLKIGNETYSIPFIFLFFLLIVLLAFLIMRYTVAGRELFAIGGNRSAAEVAGIPVKRRLLFVYGGAGVLAALGGGLYSVMTRQGDPASLIGIEMTIISIVVLGGVDINGGKGSITGVILGLLFVTIINNSLILIGVESYWHQLIIGITMFINAAIVAYRGRLSRKKVKEVNLDDRAMQKR